MDGAEQTPGGGVKWRYSLRWKLPYPCPGEHELVSEVVEAGQPAPASVMPVNWLNDRIIFRESECGQYAGIWAMMCPALEAFCLMT